MRSKKSSLRLGSCAKLAPRYCGSFEILSRIGQVAYQLALPLNLRVHNVFHISVLKKYVHDATHVINWNDVQVELDCILDRREITLRKCTISQVKVQWKHLSLEEATWELESNMRDAYPILFQGNFEDDATCHFALHLVSFTNLTSKHSFNSSPKLLSPLLFIYN